MKNVLSDSQKFKLANWLVENKDKGFSRTSAAWAASSELPFDVTYSNMQSAENTTGISLVKVKEVKRDEDKEYMASLLINVMHKVGIAVPMRLHQISLAMEIKPSAPKPGICHKHG